MYLTRHKKMSELSIVILDKIPNSQLNVINLYFNFKINNTRISIMQKSRNSVLFLLLFHKKIFF